MRTESVLMPPLENPTFVPMNSSLADVLSSGDSEMHDHKPGEWESLIDDSGRNLVERGGENEREEMANGVQDTSHNTLSASHAVVESPGDLIGMSSTKDDSDPLGLQRETIKYYLHVGDDRLEATLLDTPDAIDFGLVGMCVTAASFVGLRYVRPPLEVSPRTRTQAHTHSSVPPTPAKLSPPRRTISDFLSDILSPQRERARSSSLSPSNTFPNRQSSPGGSGGPTLPPWTHGTSPLHQLLGLTPPQYASSPSPPPQNKEESRWHFLFHRGEGGGGGAAAAAAAAAAVEEQQPMTPPHVASPPRRDVAGSTSDGRSSRASLQVSRSSDPGAGSGQGQLHTWEVVWKEGRTGGPLQRQKFDTTLAGYNKVRGRLDAWAQTASSSTVMTEAARAAVAANGGQLPENQSLTPHRGSPRVSAAFGGGEDVPPPLGNYVYEGASPVSAGRRRLGGCLNSCLSPSYGRRTSAEGETMSPLARRRSSGKGDRGLALPGGAVQTVGDPTRGGAVVAPGKEPPPEATISWGSIMVEGKFLPRREGESLIVKDGQVKALAAALPARLRASTWILLYSTSRDGISLSTLYRKVSKKGPSLLLVRDRKQYVFGCFASEDWRTAPRYYGNGECFVFQVSPELRAFKWTRANSYFMFSTPEQLAIGGGGHYAMLLRGDLLSGSSGDCETFGNKVLASSEEYEVAHVEVWGFR